MGKVCQINPKNPDLPNTFIYIDLESVSNGVLLKEERIYKKDAPSRAQRLLKSEDILFQMVRPYQMNNLFFDRNDDYVASTGYAQLRTKENPKFIFQYLHHHSFVNEVIKKCTGTSYPAINSTDLSNIKISIPSYHEQVKISSLLHILDLRLQTQNEIIDNLNSLLKNFSHKIFTKELRFNKDKNKLNREWSLKKLGDICEKKSSNISANKIEDNFGEYIVYGASGILKHIDFYKEENDFISIIKDGAGVGRLLYCKGKSSVLGTMDIIKPKENINTHYLFYLLNTINFDKYVTGSTIPHIYFRDYKNETCYIPALDEQSKIANFLNCISEKLEVEKLMLEKYQNQKKYFLQNMFI